MQSTATSACEGISLGQKCLFVHHSEKHLMKQVVWYFFISVSTSFGTKIRAHFYQRSGIQRGARYD